jgi:ABC-type branched-subunit amino acid transport system substrate-binding protein
MKRLRLLLIGPEGNEPSPVDQSLGARLAALHGPGYGLVDLEEDSFERGDLGYLEQRVHRWVGKISGIVGATNVPESIRLSEIAEKLNVLCFLSNNNVSVWQGRRQVFHIGLPTAQTAAAVAQLLQRAGLGRVFLLHDETEFQARVAANMVGALDKCGIRANSKAGSESGWLDEARRWKPQVFYLIYSEENRALPVARLFRSEEPRIPLLLGRSLLRSSFIASLGAAAEGVLFVDLFPRDKQESTRMVEFTKALFQERVDCPTANHGFGWDAMALCAVALSKGGGDPLHAIEYLESGAIMEGVTGQFRFRGENHNGREGPGPTRISRWHNGRIEEVSHV